MDHLYGFTFETQSPVAELACDVVVVGAGLAGLVAAIAATEVGASVIVLEKMPRCGGSTRLAGAAFGFCGTDIQRSAGIADSDEKLRHDLATGDPHLVDKYVDSQLGAYDWLRNRGVQFHGVSLGGGQSVPRDHYTDPRHLVDTLYKRLSQSNSCRFLAGTPVRRLVREAQTGAIQGVTCLVEGTETIVHASSGIVVATGGFSRSRDLQQRFVPAVSDALPMGGDGNTGDGLKMSWSVGADAVDLPFVRGTFGASTVPARAASEFDDVSVNATLMCAMYRGAIIVNKEGQRFVDESMSYKAIGEECLKQSDAIAYQIFDSSIMGMSQELPSVNNFHLAMSKNLIYRAPTLAELAKELNISSHNLKATVERYNSAVDGFVGDEYGRRMLTRGFGQLRKLEGPEFFGYPCTTGLTSTFGGVKIDSSARVLDIFGDVIPHLYACGEVAGGLHGKNYMSGASLVGACVFARAAVQHALGSSAATPQREATQPLSHGLH